MGGQNSVRYAKYLVVCPYIYLKPTPVIYQSAATRAICHIDERAYHILGNIHITQDVVKAKLILPRRQNFQAIFLIAWILNSARRFT